MLLIDLIFASLLRLVDLVDVENRGIWVAGAGGIEKTENVIVADGRRVLIGERGLVAYVPGYARWPYEVHLVVRAHLGALPDLPAAGRRALGSAMQRVARAYDSLFGVPMPYMMALHQRPTDGRDHPQAHLHAEFYPIMRDRGKLKYLAGSESGAGVFINDTLAEESAARLRQRM